MDKIYEVWCITPDYEYPLLQYIDVISREYRHQVININRKIVEETCEYRNLTACEDKRYEIRELTREEHENLPEKRMIRKRDG